MYRDRVAGEDVDFEKHEWLEGWFVPVDKCIHGNYDGHWHCKYMDDGARCGDTDHDKWCPGAIGEDRYEG